MDHPLGENATGVEPRIWYRSQPFHFDYFLPAFLTLFEVATLEGWVDVMYRANDVVGTHIGPCRDASAWHALFFVVLPDSAPHCKRTRWKAGDRFILFDRMI